MRNAAENIPRASVASARQTSAPRPAPGIGNANEIAPGLTCELLANDRVAIGRNYVFLIVSKAEAIGLAYWLSELVE